MLAVAFFCFIICVCADDADQDNVNDHEYRQHEHDCVYATYPSSNHHVHGHDVHQYVCEYEYVQLRDVYVNDCDLRHLLSRLQLSEE